MILTTGQILEYFRYIKMTNNCFNMNYNLCRYYFGTTLVVAVKISLNVSPLHSILLNLQLR